MIESNLEKRDDHASQSVSLSVTSADIAQQQQQNQHNENFDRNNPFYSHHQVNPEPQFEPQVHIQDQEEQEPSRSIACWLIILMILVVFGGTSWTLLVFIQEVSGFVPHSPGIGFLNIMEPLAFMLMISCPMRVICDNAIVLNVKLKLLEYRYLCGSMVIMLLLPVLELIVTPSLTKGNEDANLPYRNTILFVKAIMFWMGSICLHRILAYYVNVLTQHSEQYSNVDVWQPWLKIHFLVSFPWLLIQEIKWTLNILNWFNRAMFYVLYITIVIYPLFWLSLTQRKIQRWPNTLRGRARFILHLDVIAILIGYLLLIMNFSIAKN
jgi:hypothetical protein